MGPQLLAGKKITEKLSEMASMLLWYGSLKLITIAETYKQLVKMLNEYNDLV